MLNLCTMVKVFWGLVVSPDVPPTSLKVTVGHLRTSYGLIVVSVWSCGVMGGLIGLLLVLRDSEGA